MLIPRTGGTTPWEIANRAALGDEASIALWLTYIKGTKGVRQLTWSRGLRAAAELGISRMSLYKKLQKYDLLRMARTGYDS